MLAIFLNHSAFVFIYLLRQTLSLTLELTDLSSLDE